MNELNSEDAVSYYFVDDLPGAYIPATRIRNIVERLRQGKPLSTFTLNHLKNQGLEALYLYLTGCSTVDEFQKSARVEQVKRQQAAVVLRLEREAEQQAIEAARQVRVEIARGQAEAARRAREQAPGYIAKIKDKKLRSRYELDIYIEEDCFTQLMGILRRVDAGKRLTDTDVLWLSTEAKGYYTDALRSAFHELEAFFSRENLRKIKTPGWLLMPVVTTVNAIRQEQQKHY